MQELTNVVPTLPNLSSLVPTNYLAIDGSPELRRHPILDQFVKDMGNDPLALANYVINEIDLTDAIDYDTNYNSQPVINLGGLIVALWPRSKRGRGRRPSNARCSFICSGRQEYWQHTSIQPTPWLQMLDLQFEQALTPTARGDFRGRSDQFAAVDFRELSAGKVTASAPITQIFPSIMTLKLRRASISTIGLPTNYKQRGSS